MSERMSPKQFRESEGVGDWRVINDGACAFFRTTSIAQSANFMKAIGDIAGIDAHRPLIDVRHDGVTVRLLTREDDYYGMSGRDVELARMVSASARKLGLAADPSAVHGFLVIPGARDIKAIMPFWKAILGYIPRPDSPAEDLVDPHDIGPGFWFENMKVPREDGGGAIHVTVWLPYELAKARVDAALAAGGRMVRDSFAPTWWTLADAAGNECDVSTTQGRD